ncbi:MAG: hypothetical protein OXG08_09210 [Gammaproteobacteria bacterium]|nr:hypothetical protein [Gammaproteobacteria bacterium]
MEEFEVYDYCVKYVNKEFSSNKARDLSIRKAAYNHGTEPQKVMHVLVVELRDSLLDTKRDNE